MYTWYKYDTTYFCMLDINTTLYIWYNNEKIYLIEIQYYIFDINTRLHIWYKRETICLTNLKIIKCQFFVVLFPWNCKMILLSARAEMMLRRKHYTEIGLRHMQFTEVGLRLKYCIELGLRHKHFTEPGLRHNVLS